MLGNKSGNSFLIFSVKLLLLTSISFIATYFIYNSKGFAVDAIVYGIFAYLFILTLGVHILLNKANKKTSTQFITAFMSITSGKIFLSIGLLVVYFMMFEASNKANAITFSVFYILFSFFEIASFLKHVKN